MSPNRPPQTTKIHFVAFLFFQKITKSALNHSLRSVFSSSWPPKGVPSTTRGLPGALHFARGPRNCTRDSRFAKKTEKRCLLSSLLFVFLMFFRRIVNPTSLHGPPGSPQGTQGVPEEALIGPEVGPRSPQAPPKPLHEAPKRDPSRPTRPHENPKDSQGPPRTPQDPLKTPHEPKSSLEAPRDFPKRHPSRPKISPRGPTSSQGGSQVAPRARRARLKWY